MPKTKSDQARLDIKQVFTFCHFLFLLTTTLTRKFPKIVQTRSGIDNPVMTNVNTSVCKEKTSEIGKQGNALNLPTFNVENLTLFSLRKT